MFFDQWQGVWRVLIVGSLAYLSLVVLLRVSGKRTLSKMNAFDLIVTVALGSTLATVLLSKDVTLVEGIAAFGLLIGLQFLITWSSTRWEGVEHLVKAEPSLLFYPGMLRRQRVTEAELLAALREQGHATLAAVDAVVLETDGSLNVLTHTGKDRGNVTMPRGMER